MIAFILIYIYKYGSSNWIEFALFMQAQRELSKLRDKLDSYSKEAVEAKNVCSMQNVLLNQKDGELKDKGRELVNIRREVWHCFVMYTVIKLIYIHIKHSNTLEISRYCKYISVDLLITHTILLQLDGKIDMLTQQNAQLQDAARERSNYHEKLK